MSAVQQIHETFFGYTYIGFTVRDRPDLFDQYLNLKYQIFVAELGWRSLFRAQTAHTVTEDSFDRLGLFVIVQDANGLPVGIVRGLQTTQGFPYQELFYNHINKPWFKELLDSTSTVNSLGLLPKHRGKRFAIKGYVRRASIGQLLFFFLAKLLLDTGTKVILLTTAAEGPPRRLFERLGCYTIDHDFSYPQVPYKLVNMALLVNDTRRFVSASSPLGLLPKRELTGAERDAEAYFSEREELCLQKGD